MNAIDARPARNEDNLLGLRVLAGLIDHTMVLVAFFAVRLTLLSGDDPPDGAVPRLLYLVFLAVLFGYFFIQEAAWGRTLGKRVTGLRVVASEGELTRGRVAARTVFRLIDGLALYAVAIAAILVSKQDQRIGDMVAGTRVVREVGGHAERSP